MDCLTTHRPRPVHRHLVHRLAAQRSANEHLLAIPAAGVDQGIGQLTTPSLAIVRSGACSVSLLSASVGSVSRLRTSEAGVWRPLRSRYLVGSVMPSSARHRLRAKAFESTHSFRLPANEIERTVLPDGSSQPCHFGGLHEPDRCGDRVRANGTAVACLAPVLSPC